VLSITSALAIEKRDADFFSVRTTMHKDMSGKRGDPKGKYFRESPLSRAQQASLARERTLLTDPSSTDESVYVPQFNRPNGISILDFIC
jgi:hypothetical protein